MTLFEILPLVQGIFSGTLLILFFWKSQKVKANQMFSGFLASMALWGFAIFVMRFSDNLDHALWAYRVAMIFVSSTSVFFYHFVLLYTNTKVSLRHLIVLYFYQATVIFLSPTALLAEGIISDNYGNVALFGPLFPIFIIPIYLLVTMTIYRLYKARQISISYESRNRLLYFILGISAVLAGSVLDVLSTIGVPIYPGSTLANIGWTLLTGVAILKYHLFDIELTTHRVTPYFVMFAVITTPLILMLSLANYFWPNTRVPTWLWLVVILFIATFASYIWEKANYWTGKLFYRERHDHLEAIKSLRDESMSIKMPSSTIMSLPTLIQRAMQSSKVYLLARSQSAGSLNLVASSDTIEIDSQININADSPIIEWLENHDGILRSEDLTTFPQLQAIAIREKEVLERIGGRLYIPLRGRDELIGMLVLSSKINNLPYSWEDEEILRTVTERLALYFENVLLYQSSLDRERWLANLNTMAQSLNQALDLQQILHSVVDNILDIFKIKHCGIAMLNRERTYLNLNIKRGISDDEEKIISPVKIGEGLVGFAAKSGDPRFVESLAELDKFLKRDELDLVINKQWKSGMFVPLKQREGVSGIMLAFTEGERIFNSRERDLLITVSNQISIVIENAQLVRETVEVETLREVDRLKSQLLSTVSHDFRNPLTAIRGYSSLLLEDEHELDSDLSHKYLESIVKATDRLVELVDNLLDMSQLESGVLAIKRVSADIVELINDAADEVRVRLQDRPIITEIEEKIPELHIDPKRIRQVIDNLLDNAAKYSDSGTEVAIRAKVIGREVVVSVTDQGKGIGTVDLERVFDRMYRVEQNPSSDIGGFGLGLAICKGLIEAHGGRIWVESEAGKGSTFYFALRK